MQFDSMGSLDMFCHKGNKLEAFDKIGGKNLAVEQKFRILD